MIPWPPLWPFELRRTREGLLAPACLRATTRPAPPRAGLQTGARERFWLSQLGTLLKNLDLQALNCKDPTGRLPFKKNGEYGFYFTVRFLVRLFALRTSKRYSHHT